MVYNILYIEDDTNYGSMVSEIEKDGEFSVEVWSPNSLEESKDKIDGKDALIIDFRLTHSKTIVDGPSFAQTFRTYNSGSHKDIPIFLFSVEDNIIDYYKDFTSQDLFDFSVPKGEFLKNSEKYKSRIKSAIVAYNQIRESKNNLDIILGIDIEFISTKLDYRIPFTLENSIYQNDIYAYSNFILKNLIQSIGPLIGEDVLSARLGISKNSKDWPNLLNQIENCKYTGIYSNSYNRWWIIKILDWFQGGYQGGSTLRRLNSIQRCDEIKKITGLTELIPIDKISTKGYEAKSSNFWAICKHTKKAIDPIDGFEIYYKELHPWEDKEYISFLGISSEYSKFLKPSEKKRISEIESSLRK